MIYSPVFEMLLKYAKLNNQRFHMPGHKGDGVLFGGVGEELLKLDVTELDDTDNLLNPKGAFKEAQQLLSKRHKSYKSYIITGGATLGNLAMIMSLLKEGEKIIVDRNCHISVFSALSFSGAVPVYTDSNFASESGVLSCVSAEEIRRKTEENPDAKAVFITSPNSFGQVAPIKEISEICQEKGMLLLVDEAHGAHFPYSDMLPDSATESGADASVVSYHKTMPSLTQSAVLNVGNSALCEQIENTLHMLMTSSSSFLLAASVDYGRAYMEEEGFKKAEKLMKLIDENRPENVMVCGDKLRVTALIDGEKYLPYLRGRGIEPEMYGKGYAVFIITACDSEEKVLNLLNVLKNIPKTEYVQPEIPTGKMKMTPRQAYLAEGEWVEAEKAAGRVLKKTVYAYPPGVPLLAGGEEISSMAADYIAGNNLFGTDDKKIFVVRE